ARYAPRAPPAPGRPAGDPRRARQDGCRGGLPPRHPRSPPAMSDTASERIGAIPDDAALRESIRQRVESAGTSFYWAMRLLPKDRRDGMYAVYAFCREVDDIADDTSSPEHKKAALAAWHAEIDA